MCYVSSYMCMRICNTLQLEKGSIFLYDSTMFLWGRAFAWPWTHIILSRLEGSKPQSSCSPFFVTGMTGSPYLIPGCWDLNSGPYAYAAANGVTHWSFSLVPSSGVWCLLGNEVNKRTGIGDDEHILLSRCFIFQYIQMKAEGWKS